MTPEPDEFTLGRQASHARAEWAEASKEIADAGDDLLVVGEFGNEGDDELSW